MIPEYVTIHIRGIDPLLMPSIADLCRGVTCDHGAHCDAGKCICPTRCPRGGGGEHRLCGSDLSTVSEYMRAMALSACGDQGNCPFIPCEYYLKILISDDNDHR